MVAPSRLDVLTPRGMEANLTAHRVAEAAAARWGLGWSPTPEGRPALVDGAFTKAGRLYALAECKVRSDSRAEIRKWGDTYLITYEKLYKGKELAAGLALPLVLVVYLRPDEMVHVWKVSTPDGRWAVPYDARETTTRATVNGGTATRLNAFLPFTASSSFPWASNAPLPRPQAVEQVALPL